MAGHLGLEPHFPVSKLFQVLRNKRLTCQNTKMLLLFVCKKINFICGNHKGIFLMVAGKIFARPVLSYISCHIVEKILPVSPVWFPRRENNNRCDLCMANKLNVQSRILTSAVSFALWKGFDTINREGIWKLWREAVLTNWFVMGRKQWENGGKSDDTWEYLQFVSSKKL